MAMQFTAVYLKVPEGYIGFVEEIPGANTQGETLEEVRENLQDAVEMVLDANRELAEASLRGQESSGSPCPSAPREAHRSDFDIWSATGVNSCGKGRKRTVYVNRAARKSSAVPRHQEINEMLARKICNDLQIAH